MKRRSVLALSAMVLAARPAGVLRAQESARSVTAEQLDQMLAPIALYPDALLAQVLMAATYPLEVVEAARWSQANPNLKGDAAVAAVKDKSWDVSVKSLVAFPSVLKQLSDHLDWTQKLGDALIGQQADVATRPPRPRLRRPPGRARHRKRAVRATTRRRRSATRHRRRPPIPPAATPRRSTRNTPRVAPPAGRAG